MELAVAELVDGVGGGCFADGGGDAACGDDAHGGRGDFGVADFEMI